MFDIVRLPDGHEGTVISINTRRQEACVNIHRDDSGAWVPLADLEVISRPSREDYHE